MQQRHKHTGVTFAVSLVAVVKIMYADNNGNGKEDDNGGCVFRKRAKADTCKY
jgi:hypothetical protein